jgi:hypothetical protein
MVLALIAMVCAGALPARAQKIDSLALRLHMPRDKSVDAVVAAFAQSGLTVTNTTTSLVESDQGSLPTFGGKTQRIVRAVLFGADSTTTVVMTGDEIRMNDDGSLLRRLRIDNRAGGNGGKVWKRMVAAAMMLDSASVPEAAREKP